MPSWGGASPSCCAFPDSSLWLSLHYGGHVVPLLVLIWSLQPWQEAVRADSASHLTGRMLSPYEVRRALAAQRAL